MLNQKEVESLSLADCIKMVKGSSDCHASDFTEDIINALDDPHAKFIKEFKADEHMIVKRVYHVFMAERPQDDKVPTIIIAYFANDHYLVSCIYDEGTEAELKIESEVLSYGLSLGVLREHGHMPVSKIYNEAHFAAEAKFDEVKARRDDGSL